MAATAVEPTDARPFFRANPGSWFALLDAARAPDVPALLADSGEEHLSLYDGDQGKELEPYGPWLVRFSPGSPLLDRVLADGWGNAWGVYLTAPAVSPLADLRKHFRRFLMVNLPDGRQAYFRFYDPRVLRTYLPTCTAAEATQFFGPVGRFVAEADDPNFAWEFRPDRRERRPLA